ncbi:HK97 family phage prohead protease [Nocardia sp. NBC_00565]|uniref:HK97 family phage prohead protease n=1 Tax=Nocardia sp. NBC_00565 TaxID=2975993 RepID=UPI002E803F29|nr:HK97 family phage prohead protease [Nocardia sp. NBC_00565]WUC03736.1 HK97 family phage prohead protease [Nocardia sp. NBC_00565]
MATELTSPAREDLCRSVPFTLTRDGDPAGDGLTFEGYGAVFNAPTRIDSWEGTFDEQIAPGAFKKSIRENTPKFQFDHGHHPLIGSIPIGRITDIHEDTSGLYVEARLSDNWLVEPIRDAIAEGSVDGMSFRFSVVREEWRDQAGKVVKPEDVIDILWQDAEGRGPLMRTLKELKVAEVGPVVWPAYEQTSASVRSTVIDLGRLNDPEQRKLLARAVFMVDAADNSDSSERSDEEPQDTTSRVAVEHSDEDADPPQPTEKAGEHETDSTEPAPTDDVDAARAAAFEHQFEVALNEVTYARASTPPLRKPQ